MHQTHAICAACDTVAHCSKHGCIPVAGSLHHAIDQKVRETLATIDGPYTPSPAKPVARAMRSCNELGVCQGRTPACLGCNPFPQPEPVTAPKAGSMWPLVLIAILAAAAFAAMALRPI